MKKILKPQEGPQENFLATSADIAIYGGAAGGGKTYALLLESARNMKNPKYGAVIFRRQSIQITQEGGLWDSSFGVYGGIKGAEPKSSPRYHWRFRSGARVNFAHIDGDKDLDKWQGSQIPLICFDELTHFTKRQFFYMLSRNRTTCGVRPYVRASCNPDADSWVADFIMWWIDQNTGYPIPERSGKIRWMVHMHDVIFWFDTKEEGIQFTKNHGLDDKKAEYSVKSVTFIASTLQDNKILMDADPTYIANLLALTEVEKERLLYGNWKIKASAGKYFKRSQIGPSNMLSQLPADVVYWCRAWDIAATDETEGGDPDYTAGVLIGKRRDGSFIVADVINQLVKAGDVEKLIKMTAISDRAKYGTMCYIRVPQDPGASGKIVAKSYVKMLAGFNVKSEAVSGSKELRATPFAAQWQNGNVYVLIADWNEMYFNQLESFPASSHDDMVDASSDAFNECAAAEFNIDNLL